MLCSTIGTKTAYVIATTLFHCEGNITKCLVTLLGTDYKKNIAYFPYSYNFNCKLVTLIPLS